MLDFRGYQTFRKDLNSTKERGIVILIANHLKFWELKCFEPSANSELAIIKIQHNFLKSMTIACLYRHPNYKKDVLNDDNDKICDIFTKLKNESSDFVVLGDFNLKDNYINPLLSHCKSMNIEQVVNIPTRQNKLLDLIFVKNHDNVIKTKVYDAALADHLLTQCIYKYKHSKPNLKKVTFRAFTEANIARFILNLENEIYNDSADFDMFLNTFYSILNKHIPLCSRYLKITTKKTQASSTTKRLRRERNRLYLNNKRIPCSTKRSQLKVLTKKLKSQILKDSSTEVNNNIFEKGLWQGLNKSIQIKAKNDPLTNMSPDSINDFYVQISSQSGNEKVDLPSKPENVNPNKLKFSLMPFTTEEINKAWKRMKNHSSGSVDPLGISNKILGHAMNSPKFVRSLSHIFNSFNKDGYVPDCLKIARIVPIPKGKKATTPNETRPISIQSVFTKLLDKCIYKQLNLYFERNCLFSKYQFGFRQKLTTSHALVALTDYVYENLDDNQICAIIALDLQKAFDSVNRDILIEKMKWYGIDNNLIKSLIHGRSQYVELNNMKSERKYTTKGIQQGAATSSLYFSIYINDMPECIEKSKTFIFADDTNIANACHVNDTQQLIQDIEYDLVKVKDWLNINKVKLNVDKTQLLIISKPKLKVTHEDIKIFLDNIEIKKVNVLKILGIQIDSHLTFIEHCNFISKKCYKNVSMLYPLKNILSTDNKTILVNAYVMSIISYGSVIWMNNLNNECNRIINKVLKTAARFIFNKRKYDSITSNICKDLEWLFPKRKYIYECLIMAYKMCFHMHDGFFADYLDFSNTSVQNTRRSVYSKPSLKCMSFWGERRFKYKAVYLWLQMPESVIKCNIANINIFKKSLMSFLLNCQNEELLADNDDKMFDYSSCIDDVIRKFTTT